MTHLLRDARNLAASNDLGGNSTFYYRSTAPRYNDADDHRRRSRGRRLDAHGHARSCCCPLGGEPLIRRTVRQVCDAGFDEVLVVAGIDARAGHRAALDGLRCRHAVNAHTPAGMGSSFRTGVVRLGDSEAAMFALADQPFVTTAEYQDACSTPIAGTRPAIVSVRYGDVMAPPHLFEREFFPELARARARRPAGAPPPRGPDRRAAIPCRSC